MNPDNDKPNVLPPSDDSANATPGSSAGDDAALQAIEALEAESNELSSPELSTPATPVFTPPTPSPKPTPVINDPLTPSSSELDSTPDPTPSTLDGPKPLSDAAASEPPAAIGSAASFKPFEEGKKKSKKSLIILIIVVLVLALGIGGFFGWQYLQSQNATPANNTVPETSVPEDEQELTDNEASVNTTIEEMETELKAVTDQEYADSTLSDAALNN